MTSKFSNKYLIPEKFPKILHDYAREVVRYMPEDIFDFSIQYFYSLEKGLKLNYIQGGSKDIPKISENNKLNANSDLNISVSTNPNTQNMFYNNNATKENNNKEKKEIISETNDKKLLNKESFSENFKDEHPDTYPFYCNHCDRGFFSQEALLSHEKDSSKHRKIMNTLNFLCDICKRKFRSKSALENHERAKQHFQCNICGKTFASKKAIIMHSKDLNHYTIFKDD